MQAEMRWAAKQIEQFDKLLSKNRIAERAGSIGDETSRSQSILLGQMRSLMSHEMAVICMHALLHCYERGGSEILGDRHPTSDAQCLLGDFMPNSNSISVCGGFSLSE